MAKRINFYSVKLIKEKGALYELDSKQIQSPETAYNIINEVMEFETLTKEHFVIATLNSKNNVMGIHVIHIGSLNASIVHPREVYQQAILNNAASIVCYHNHPSGDPSPSNEDKLVTKKLVEAGKILGIELMDHIVVGSNGRFVSLKEKGDL